MKLSKTKKILLLGTSLLVLTTSIVTPIVFLNKDENNHENDVEKIFKILKAKTTKEKTIELPSNASGKIIANNQEQIIEKIKTLIGKVNLKKVKIEVLMENDTNISNFSQKVIIKLTKNEISKEIEDFSVKKKNVIDEDIESIKKVLDAKTSEDLIINLSSDSSGKIIGNNANKDAIVKKLRELIDPSNTNGDPNHQSLKGTTIEISMSVDASISTTPQNIIVSISKTGGTTLTTTKTFQVKKESTADKDIVAIKNILDAKIGNDLIIILPSSSSGNVIGNNANKNAIEKELRKLIDPSNINGNPNHASLRGATIKVSKSPDAIISTTPQDIVVSISKTNGKTLRTTKTFQVKRDFTANEDIAAIKNIFDSKSSNDRLFVLPNDSSGSIINNLKNKEAIERKVRKLIDPSNTSGDTNHPSLRGTKITLAKVVLISGLYNNDLISDVTKIIIITISKNGGTSVDYRRFAVAKAL